MVMSLNMIDKLEFIVQANFTWMEIVWLRKYFKLHLKIHYVKVFRYFLSLFLSRKKKARKWPKKAKRKTVVGWVRHAENSLKKHERILGTGDCRECSRKCVFSFLLTQNGWKSQKVCYVSRKSGLKIQADRSVRQADSAGRLDFVDSTNKRFKGWWFLRGGGNRNPPTS